MTTKGFVVTHECDASFERGLRSFFEYRDLGIERATEGAVVAHVIRESGREFSSQPHAHSTTFEMLEVVMPADFATHTVDNVDTLAK